MEVPWCAERYLHLSLLARRPVGSSAQLPPLPLIPSVARCLHWGWAAGGAHEGWVVSLLSQIQKHLLGLLSCRTSWSRMVTEVEDIAKPPPQDHEPLQEALGVRLPWAAVLALLFIVALSKWPDCSDILTPHLL